MFSRQKNTLYLKSLGANSIRARSIFDLLPNFSLLPHCVLHRQPAPNEPVTSLWSMNGSMWSRWFKWVFEGPRWVQKYSWTEVAAVCPDMLWRNPLPDIPAFPSWLAASVRLKWQAKWLSSFHLPTPATYPVHLPRPPSHSGTTPPIHLES